MRIKGQMKIDYIFALIFFAIMIFYVGIQINNALVSSISDSKLDTMKSEAGSILGILISTEGSPKNWESLPESQTVRIGLASSPHGLSQTKLNTLKNNCNFMNKFGNINYRLTISAGNSILLSCGYGGPRVTSKAEMPVFANGAYGKAVLEMW